MLRVDYNLNLGHRFVCRGRVDLRDAYVKGDVIAGEARFRHPEGIALDASGITVGQDLSFARARISGGFRLQKADVHGSIDLSDVRHDGRTKSKIDCTRAKLGGSLYVTDARLGGGLAMLDASVGGHVVADGAHFGVPAAAGDRRPAGFDISRSRIAGDLRLASCTLEGDTRLSCAQVKGQLVLDGAKLSSKDVLTLYNASVGGDAYMNTATPPFRLNLTDCHVGNWLDQESSDPEELQLDGFTYDTIAKRGSVERRLSWIAIQHKYVAQPYTQLARCYRAAGDDKAARKVLVTRERRRRCPSTGRNADPAAVWSWFLRSTIGYGYEPVRAIAWTVGLVIFGSGLEEYAFRTGSVVRNSPADGGHVTFNCVSYTLDLLLPIADLGQRDAFTPVGYAAWASLVLILFGWLLAVVVGAGVTGLFERG